MQHSPSSCTTIGDDEAIREGCEWVRHFEQIDPARRLVYRCIETLLELGSAGGHRAALEHLRHTG